MNGILCIAWARVLLLILYNKRIEQEETTYDCGCDSLAVAITTMVPHR